tara:strand:+ start:161 stop:1552 length:1392 start_codon:yes stop_codon:yes gene_type:complete
MDLLKTDFLILGMGASGIGAAKLLKRSHKKVVIIDENENQILENKAKELINNKINAEIGIQFRINNLLKYIDKNTIVITSPSIPWNSKILNQIRKLNIKIKSEVEIALDYLKEFKWVGITGTNGKSTVTTMLTHILNKNNINAPMAGNIGISISDVALNIFNSNENPEWIIIELSSYQIEASPGISPHIGIWTNLTPDHLERHGTIEKYSAIKKQLLDRSSIRIYNADDEFLFENKAILEEGIWVKTKKNTNENIHPNLWINPDGLIIENGEILFDSSCFKAPGNHNLQNLLLATAAAREIGLSGDSIQRSLESFKGVPHRLEIISSQNNLTVYNDSKATNYSSSEVGIAAVKGPVIVIAGGVAKRGSANSWVRALKQKACLVILFGQDKNQLKDKLKKYGFSPKIYTFLGLEESVNKAFSLVSHYSASSIILSPACSSFDQYSNFEARGNHFKKIVSSIISL